MKNTYEGESNNKVTNTLTPRTLLLPHYIHGTWAADDTH